MALGDRALLTFIIGKEKVFHVPYIRGETNQNSQTNGRRRALNMNQATYAKKNMEGIKTPFIARWESKHLNSLGVFKIGRTPRMTHSCETRQLRHRGHHWVEHPNANWLNTQQRSDQALENLFKHYYSFRLCNATH